MTEATLLNRLKRYGYGQHYGPMAKACAEAAVEIERLQAALSRYGDHFYDCGMIDNRQCDCGYCAALGVE